MEQFYLFILRNDVWIFIVCLLGLFWYGSEFFRAQRILRSAMFGLERETGTRIRNNAVLIIFLLGTILGFVYFVNSNIAPNLPIELLLPPTSTPDIFKTPLSSPTALSSPVPTITPPLVPTITLAGQAQSIPNAQPDQPGLDEATAATATPTITPGPTPTPAVACTLELNISEPREGSTVNGAITFTGTAVNANFGGYRIEANGPQTNGEWASLLGRTIDQSVQDNILGSANLSQWEAGPYLIRLVVVNPEDVVLGICVTQITLSN